jgi:polyisoprenoid-binding protein YceI
MASQTATVPGYLTGTWTIDPVHSDASFTVRHLGVSKVRGRFDSIEGTIVTAENPLESTVNVTIHAHTISTKNDQRDAHVRGEDFLDVEKYPTLTFRSTAVRVLDGETGEVDGELTRHGVTRPVTLKVEVGGFGDGMQGGKVAGFSASTEISRTDFGITGGPAGGVVSDKVKIELDIEASRP